jgi:hypothetical protein
MVFIENLKNRKRPIQEEAQKLKFQNIHCNKLQNQIYHPLFDGLIQNFAIGSIT